MAANAVRVAAIRTCLRDPRVAGRGCDTVLLGLFLGRPLNYLLSTGAPSSSCVSKFEWGPGKIECLGMGLGFSWSYPTTTEGGLIGLWVVADRQGSPETGRVSALIGPKVSGHL